MLERKNKIGLEKKKQSKQNRPLYNQYDDSKHTIFEQTNKRWKFIDHKGNEMDNMLDKSMCMRDQTVAGYNNRTNRSLQAGEDVCCWGITRERRVSNHPLCSFPSILKKSHLILLPTSTRSRCIAQSVLTKESQESWTPPGYSTRRELRVRSNAKEHVQLIESTDHRQHETWLADGKSP